MKLYYSPGTCALAPHIALAEAGADYQLEKVDLKTKTTETGHDYTQVNDNGYVPAIQLDDGFVLTEGPAIMQYIADQTGNQLAPQNGTMGRYKMQEWLNFITSELHKGIGAFFNETYRSNAEVAEAGRKRVHERLRHIEKTLAAQKSDYLTGSAFSIADGYLFTVLRWTTHAGIPLDGFPHIQAFMARVAKRPAVVKALAEQGIS